MDGKSTTSDTQVSDPTALTGLDKFYRCSSDKLQGWCVGAVLDMYEKLRGRNEGPCKEDSGAPIRRRAVPEADAKHDLQKPNMP